MTPQQRAEIKAAARALVRSWGPLTYPRDVLDDIAFLLQPTSTDAGTHPTGGAGTGPGRAA